VHKEHQKEGRNARNDAGPQRHSPGKKKISPKIPATKLPPHPPKRGTQNARNEKRACRCIPVSHETMRGGAERATDTVRTGHMQGRTLLRRDSARVVHKAHIPPRPCTLPNHHPSLLNHIEKMPETHLLISGIFGAKRCEICAMTSWIILGGISVQCRKREERGKGREDGE
jgi:hypothetical protein